MIYIKLCAILYKAFFGLFTIIKKLYMEVLLMAALPMAAVLMEAMQTEKDHLADFLEDIITTMQAASLQILPSFRLQQTI